MRVPVAAEGRRRGAGVTPLPTLAGRVRGSGGNAGLRGWGPRTLARSRYGKLDEVEGGCRGGVWGRTLRSLLRDSRIQTWRGPSPASSPASAGLRSEPPESAVRRRRAPGPGAGGLCDAGGLGDRGAACDVGARARVLGAVRPGAFAPSPSSSFQQATGIVFQYFLWC